MPRLSSGHNEARKFIIFSLPRTGTKMLVSGLNAHPEIPYVVHEFVGDKRKFLENPYILTNHLYDWAQRTDAVRICLYREDSIAGALSLLKMAYGFPDLSFDIPVDEVSKLAKFRREAERRMREASQYEISYEQLTNGEQIERLPFWFVDEFCSWVGIESHPMPVHTKKREKMRARNEAEIWRSA